MAASRLPEPWPDSGQDAKKRFSRLGKRAREQVDVDDSDGDDGDPGGEPEHNPPGPVAGKMKTGVTAKVKTCHFTPTPFTSCLLGRLIRGEATPFTTVESLHCRHCLHFESSRMMNLSSALL